jgi:hypothetical protein
MEKITLTKKAKIPGDEELYLLCETGEYSINDMILVGKVGQNEPYAMVEARYALLGDKAYQ